MKEKLFGKTLEELKLLVRELGLPTFTATQIADWLYRKDIFNIKDMSNLSKKARGILDEKFEFGITEPIQVQESKDGTKKYLFPVSGQNYIESAYIPELKRNTLCVSSQAGCMRRCTFCMTGRQGLLGNLSTGEILNQVKSLPEKETLTNIVYMGMGEPFDNFNEVMKSLEIMTSDWGFGWSPKRITVSTIGILPAVRDFLVQSSCNLAISLHSPYDAEREKLLPVEKAHPASGLIEEIRNTEINRYRKISFEYIMFKGLNDTPHHAIALAMLLSGIRCRVNLIHYHPIPDSPLKGTPLNEMEGFRDLLNAKGIIATIRKSRGQDIDAACGLLSTKELKLNEENIKGKG
ncbi:MAG: 23S rRNA (adenine(2503)-C(2))-methyltransferase RlmN [Bacteroidota bacterium]|nr:23S rRNA (adenine(2503)-C(2))-methyltransferase RlmN [Bacteroidota bacterium]